MKNLFTILGAALTPLFVFAATLNPSSPVQVANDESVNVSNGAPIAVTNGSGISLAIWQVNWEVEENSVYGSFSPSNETNWSADASIVTNLSVAFPDLVSNSKGFLLTWIQPDPGWGSGVPYSSFYNTQTQEWGPTVAIDSSFSNAQPQLFVKTTPQGFLATFIDGNGYANFSSDGMNWQESSAQVFSNGDISFTTVSGCGNNNLLLVACADITTGDVYISTSHDNSQTWSSQTRILEGVVGTDMDNGVGCFANAHGFLISYVDNENTLWSVFSKDGSTWGSPVQVASGLESFWYQIPSMSGNDSGCVITWLDTDGTGWASFSDNNGQTWQDPVQFTQTAALLDADLYFYAVTPNVYENKCIFAWSDANGNPYVSVSGFPNTSQSTGAAKWGLTKPLILNRPGQPL